MQTWFIVGSQHLYGEQALQQVRAHAQQVAEGLNASETLPFPVHFHALCTTAAEARAACQAARMDPECMGVIMWMHTFSPAKMWLGALPELGKPLLHLHTQLHRDLPWDRIDMDFMNLHQAAHGDREFAHGCSRAGIRRTVSVGHWQSPRVQQEIADWQRAARGKAALSTCAVARFGDNMRNVAVTDGDKVAAQLATGVRVDGYGVGDLVASVHAAPESQINAIIAEICAENDVDSALAPGGAQHHSLHYEARLEAGIRNFLDAGGYQAFTDTFEDLHGLEQLPGLAVQRLMAQGYGFGAEGDWKTAALLHAAKSMGSGLSGGCSFMEDYTYDLAEGSWKVLGAHMLEVCPSIAEERPRIQAHPLGIGGKRDPVRALFSATPGPAVNASWIDMGDQFRLIVNSVKCHRPSSDLPHLPVARALWTPQPDLPTAAAAWLYAGGAHHTVLSQALSAGHWELLADMLNIPCVVIDGDSSLRSIRQQLDLIEGRWR